MDEFDSNTTPFNESQNEQHAEGSSRRTFLKAAVVGSAAAVAVSGVGAATLTLTGHHTGLKKYLALTDSLSGVHSDACTTTSGDVMQDTFGNDTIFFWAKFDAVPAGTYTIDLSPEPGGSGSIVDYPNGAGNYVQIVFYAGGDSSFTCNPATLPDSNADYLAQQASAPVTFTTPSDGDVLFWLHVKGSSSGTETLTASLYHASNDTNLVDSASAKFTVS